MDTMDVDSQGCGWEPVAVMTVAPGFSVFRARFDVLNPRLPRPSVTAEAWRMEAAAMTTSSFARLEPLESLEPLEPEG